jgi:hypothetical protein
LLRARPSGKISLSMTVKRAHLVLTAAVLLFPSLCWACDYPYRPSTQLYQDASVIFVGKVLESPWKTDANGKVSTTGKTTLRFSVEKKLRGIEGREVTFPPVRSDCSYPFLEGATYLIHGVRTNGVVETGWPWRPLLIADATEALKYVEQTAAGKAPGLLYGVLSLGNPPPNATVQLEGRGGRFRAKAKGAHYEIVAPAGEYRAWLEVEGKMVSARATVELTPGRATLQNLD